MGLTVEVTGEINIDPPLNQKEIEYLKNFSKTRRCESNGGEYSVLPTSEKEKDFTTMQHDPSYNKIITGQPSLWCQWTPTDDGKQLVFNGDSKDYNSGEWLPYLIKHFIGKNPVAKSNNPKEFGFLQGHECNGEINSYFYEFHSLVKIKNNKILNDEPQMNKFQSLISSFKNKWNEFTHNIETKKQNFVYEKTEKNNLRKELKIEEAHDYFVSWLKARVSKRFFTNLIETEKINPDARYSFHGTIGKYPNGEDVFINEKNVTILMIAALMANRPAIEALVEHGANTNLTNSNGMTALDLLQQRTSQSQAEINYIQELLAPTKKIIKPTY